MDQGTSSMETNEESSGGASSTKAPDVQSQSIDYAATGARPKVFPLPNMKKVAKSKSTTSDGGQSFGSNALTTAFGSMTFQQPPPDPSSSTIRFGTAIGNNVDEPSQSSMEEASSVEITMDDRNIDEEFRRFIQMEQELAEQVFHIDADGNRGAPRFPVIEGATAGGQLGIGFGILPSEGEQKGSYGEGKVNCGYCNRIYDAHYLGTHIETCTDNPDVVVQRRLEKERVDKESLEIWRETPTPVTQAEWTSGPTIETGGDGEGWPMEQPYGNQQKTPVEASGWSDMVEDKIPCEYCGASVSVDRFVEHMERCAAFL